MAVGPSGPTETPAASSAAREWRHGRGSATARARAGKDAPARETPPGRSSASSGLAVS